MTLAPKIAMSDDFLKSFAAVPRDQQQAVLTFVAKFRQNPTASGINYERIRDAGDPPRRQIGRRRSEARHRKNDDQKKGRDVLLHGVCLSVITLRCISALARRAAALPWIRDRRRGHGLRPSRDL